jgi:hypothetical protein
MLIHKTNALANITIIKLSNADAGAMSEQENKYEVPQVQMTIFHIMDSEKVNTFKTEENTEHVQFVRKGFQLT